jgi:hypothetical protein
VWSRQVVQTDQGPATLTHEIADVLDTRDGRVYRNGRHRVSMKGTGTGWPRAKTFTGEMAWHQAQSYSDELSWSMTHKFRGSLR